MFRLLLLTLPLLKLTFQALLVLPTLGEEDQNASQSTCDVAAHQHGSTALSGFNLTHRKGGIGTQ
ncbi:MAG: hypothetical protein QX195_05620 [Methylococcaceae bacterium]